MKFYDRDKELKALGQAASSTTSALIVISGRRRVGKTRLINEFLKNRQSLQIMIVPKEDSQVASDFEELFTRKGFKPSFSSVRNALEYFFTVAEERILFIDEFANILEVNESIPFELQRLWDENRERNKVLILSGSYLSMMDKIFTRQKAPLFNRADLKILLEPMKPPYAWKMLDEIGILDPAEKISRFCIFGGIPYYYELMERFRGSEPVSELFFGIGQLSEEGQDMLRQEFGASYRKYFAILDAIGAGLCSAGEISAKLGMRQTTISKYIQALQTDFKLIERQVPFGDNPKRSKKGKYIIKDNLLSFWFSLVYGKRLPPRDSELNEFVSRRFELLSEDFLINWLSAHGEQVMRSGRWWGIVEVEKGKFDQREIDILVETDTHLYVGECKWSSSKMGQKELAWLRQSATKLRTKKNIRWVLFSKSGFSISESTDILLFDPNRMVEG